MAEGATVTIRLLLMTTVVLGWVLPVTVSMTVAWVMVRVCALALSVRIRTMRRV